MDLSPWSNGPSSNGLWISDDDRQRVDRFNARLAEGDARRVYYQTDEGIPIFPQLWSGNPHKASILILMLNPSISEDMVCLRTDNDLDGIVANASRGKWNKKYPNQWLHPHFRPLDRWCSSVVFGKIHKQIAPDFGEEEAWQRLSQRVALLELAPWTSAVWSTGPLSSATSFAVKLAQKAMNDPNRIVLLARGESDWKTAGLLDADLLPKSRGVRVNQSRLSQANYPHVWDKIVQLITD